MEEVMETYPIKVSVALDVLRNVTQDTPRELVEKANEIILNYLKGGN
jgi:DNA-directed RNA polymerase subunit F